MGYADVKKRRQGRQREERCNATESEVLKNIGLASGKALLTFVVLAPVAAILYYCGLGGPRMSISGCMVYAILPLAVASLIVGICWFLMKQSGCLTMSEAGVAVNEDKNNRLKEELVAWTRQRIENGGLIPVPADISLRSEEAVFYKSSAHLFETRSVRVTNHAGGGVRVSRRVGLMGGRSVSESHEEWRPITRGDFYITNQRVVFVGEMQSRTIDLKNVVSVKGGYDMIEIVSETRAKSMRFTVANWPLAKLILKHLISVRGKLLSEITGANASGGDDTTAEGAIKVDIENPYQDGVDYTALRLVKSLASLAPSSACFRNLDSQVNVPPAIRELFANSPLPASVCYATVSDALKCHLRLGHCIDDLNTEDGFGLLSIVWLLMVQNAEENFRLLTSDREVYENAIGLAKTLCEKIKEGVCEGDELFSVSLVRKSGDGAAYRDYVRALLDWATSISVVDGELTAVEQRWLDRLKSLENDGI